MTIPRFPLIPLSHLGSASEPERKFRLMEIVRVRMRARRYAVRTEQAYLFWIRRFVLHHGRRHPRELDVNAVRAFLSHLAVTDKVAASTQNQALAAVRFLYDAVLHAPLGQVDGVTPRGGRVECPSSCRSGNLGRCSAACANPIASARW